MDLGLPISADCANEFEIVFDKIRTNYPNAFRIGILVMYIVIIGTDEYRIDTIDVEL